MGERRWEGGAIPAVGSLQHPIREAQAGRAGGMAGLPKGPLQIRHPFEQAAELTNQVRVGCQLFHSVQPQIDG